MGFMARLMTLCSLLRTNPGNRLQYVHRIGPYTLGMTAGINNKLEPIARFVVEHDILPAKVMFRP